MALSDPLTDIHSRSRASLSGSGPARYGARLGDGPLATEANALHARRSKEADTRPNEHGFDSPTGFDRAWKAHLAFGIQGVAASVPA